MCHASVENETNTRYSIKQIALSPGLVELSGVAAEAQRGDEDVDDDHDDEGPDDGSQHSIASMIYQNYLPDMIFLSLIKQAEQPVSLYGFIHFR